MTPLDDEKIDDRILKIVSQHRFYQGNDYECASAILQLLKEMYGKGYNTGYQKANRNNDDKRFRAASRELRDMAERFDRIGKLQSEKEETQDA